MPHKNSTQNSGNDVDASFQHCLVELGPSIQSYISKCLPGHPEVQDDLKSEIFISTIKFYKSHKARFVKRVDSSSNESHELDRDYLRNLCFRIAKHRIADFFRASAIDWAKNAEAHDRLWPSSETTSEAEKRLVHIRLLRVCMEWISGLSEPDRQIMLYLAGERPTDAGKPMTDRERKRLSRLRKKLREHIKYQLGEDIDQLLD